MCESSRNCKSRSGTAPRAHTFFFLNNDAVILCGASKLTGYLQSLALSGFGYSNGSYHRADKSRCNTRSILTDMADVSITALRKLPGVWKCN